MKINVSCDKELNFVPINLNIQITSEEELKAFVDLFQRSNSVPNLVYGTGDVHSEQKEIMKHSMFIIYEKLQKYARFI